MTRARSARLLSLGLALFGLLLVGCGDNFFDSRRPTPVPVLKQVDQFTQSQVAGRDILWIIDQSKNMEEEAAALAELFYDFIGAIDEYDVSYQIGFITTDATNDGGELQGLIKIITRETPNADQVFSDNLKEAQTSSHVATRQEGFRALTLAFSQEMLGESGGNYGFLRKGAGLSIIIVSNEDDDSEETVDYYREFLVSLKQGSGPDRVMFSAIIGLPPEGCGEGGISAEAGLRYYEMAEVLNGVAMSICSDDFGGLLSALGEVQVALQNSFVLTHEPVEGSIFVKVNSIPQEAEAWDYVAEEGALVFKPDRVPAYGAAIAIEYHYVSEQ